MKTWGIIGLGWLGLELKNRLEADGDEVWGTHSQEFNFQSDPFPQKEADLLFLNTPPIVSMSPTDYVRKISSKAKKIILISSTSVYGRNSGKIDETTFPLPITNSAKWLVEVENRLRSQFGVRLTVIRPGGLIGGDRHPIKSLSGRTDVADGNHPINLIHRDDLIGITILAASISGLSILNAVAPFHPAKRDYYADCAEKLCLPMATFNDTDSEGREIASLFVPQFYKDWKFPKLDGFK